ncbi:MAG: phosphoenolpyruvate carboxylase [Deltaproteobacteria bacterium]|nr:phosphoenolpyruvate carboxylase [Deltaproteobacteria bacterium]
MTYNDKQLIRDIEYLQSILYEVLLEQCGSPFLKTIQLLTNASLKHHVRTRLRNIINNLDIDASSNVIQAYALNFQLINIAEENFGMQDRRQIQRSGLSVAGSIEDCISSFKKQGVSPEDINEMLNGLSIVPVITAHPTEIKRRTVLEKHRGIYLAIFKKENPIWSPIEKELLGAGIFGETLKLWQTGDIRLEKPSIEEEVENGIFYFNRTFFEMLPRLYEELKIWLKKYYPAHDFEIPSILYFGSWIGGDRDGNPFVTSEKTRWTFKRHKELILSKYIETVTGLISKMSISRYLVPVSKELLTSIREDAIKMGLDGQTVISRNPHEPYRQKLSLIKKKLENTLKTGSRVKGQSSRVEETVTQGFSLEGIKPEGLSYRTSQEFIDDLNIIKTSLNENKGERIARLDIEPLTWQIQTFGFFLAKLDIRQHSEVHRMAVAELLEKSCVVQTGYLALPENEKVKILSKELLNIRPLVPDYSHRTDETREVLNTLKVIKEAQEEITWDAFGSYVISMANNASDVLTVMLLAKEVGLCGIDNEVHLEVHPTY